MIPAPSTAPTDAFAGADAGADYFASEAHYQALASRILSVFRSDHGFVLLCKDALTNLDLLGAALGKAAPRHAIVKITCRPGMSCDEILREAPTRRSFGEAASLEAGLPPGTVPLRQPSPLFLLDDADRLSYEQIEQIYDELQPDDHVTPAVVLLVQAEFRTRLERPALRFLKESLAGDFAFLQLGRDEVGPFILHQLAAAGATHVFPGETVAAIADVSEGDPAVVNRLARLVIDFAATSSSVAQPATAPKEAQVHERRRESLVRELRKEPPVQEVRKELPPVELRKEPPAQDLGSDFGKAPPAPEPQRDAASWEARKEPPAQDLKREFPASEIRRELPPLELGKELPMPGPRSEPVKEAANEIPKPGAPPDLGAKPIEESTQRMAAKPMPPPWLRRSRPGDTPEEPRRERPPAAEPPPLPLSAMREPVETAPRVDKSLADLQPPPLPVVAPAAPAGATPRRPRRLRMPFGIAVALAYVVVVGAASIGVFWLLHPAAKSFVDSGVRDISVALDSLRAKLSPAPGSNATRTPAETATAAPIAAPAEASGHEVAQSDLAPTATAAMPAPAAAPPSPAVALIPPSEPPPVPAADQLDAGANAPASPSDAAVDSTPSLAPPPVPPVDEDPNSELDARPRASAATSPPAIPQPTNPQPTAPTGAAERAAPPVASAALPPPASAPTNPPPAAMPQTAIAALPPAATATQPAPAAPKPADPAAAGLLQRGDALIALGDITSARLYYEYAADAGSARAALLAGQTFDPTYLRRIGVLGVRGDPAKAAVWYRRARDLGDPSAQSRLDNLSVK